MKKFSPRTNANVPNDGRCTFFVHFRLRFFNADITWLNAIARLRSERLKNYSWDSFKTFFPVPCRHQSLLFFLSIFGILLIKLFIATKKKKKRRRKIIFRFFFWGLWFLLRCLTQLSRSTLKAWLRLTTTVHASNLLKTEHRDEIGLRLFEIFSFSSF